MKRLFLRTLVAVQSRSGNEHGVTAIEYALIAALIGGFIIGTVATLGNRIDNAFQNILGQSW